MGGQNVDFFICFVAARINSGLSSQAARDPAVAVIGLSWAAFCFHLNKPAIQGHPPFSIIARSVLHSFWMDCAHAVGVHNLAPATQQSVSLLKRVDHSHGAVEELHAPANSPLP